jgi:hypothetical protein
MIARRIYAAPHTASAQSDHESNITIHRRARSLRPIGYSLRPCGRSPGKKILNILCELCVLAVKYCSQ